MRISSAAYQDFFLLIHYLQYWGNKFNSNSVVVNIKGMVVGITVRNENNPNISPYFWKRLLHFMGLRNLD